MQSIFHVSVPSWFPAKKSALEDQMRIGEESAGYVLFWGFSSEDILSTTVDGHILCNLIIFGLPPQLI
jgi:hypothetical protein